MSVYTSVLLTFAIYDLARLPSGQVLISQGLLQGGFIVAAVTFVALVFQNLTKDFRMHYVSKVSIILSIVSLVIFAILHIATELNRYDFVKLNTIAILIIVLVVDAFVRSYIRKGWKQSISLILNTIGLSFLMFIIISQDVVKTFVIAHPEITLYTVVADVILGKWSSMRISEFLRFRHISLKDSNDTQRTTEQT